ncbi:MAG TPA: cytochrome c biogenesis protein CcsA [Tepidisphaeraceae bacterium]
MTSVGPLILVLLACVAFAIALGVSLLSLRADATNNSNGRAIIPHRLLGKTCVYWGTLLILGALIWQCVAQGRWTPLEDNFQCLLCLGLLLAGFVLYIQYKRPIGGLDWFLLPIVIVLLISAGLFGRFVPRAYSNSAWDWTHRTSSYLGAVAFAVASAAGAMYLIANRRLRAKVALPNVHVASLERLERMTLEAVTLGFALLTIGLITGLVKALHGQSTLGKYWITSPKVILSAAVWIVYALVLHSPINPRFRGRWVAMLSILGFVLMLGTLIAVQFMPGGNR